VIEVPVDPDVSTIDADAARVITQAQEHGDRGRACTQVLQRAACGPGAPPDLTECGQQAVEGVGGAGGGDDEHGRGDGVEQAAGQGAEDSDECGRGHHGQERGEYDMYPESWTHF